MAATLVGDEKLAIAFEDPSLEFNVMGVVVAIKRKLELFELKTVSFFSIALGFLNLADHPIVHVFISFFNIYKKARVRTRAFQGSDFSFLAGKTRIGQIPYLANSI
jgi:hypothetical protein